MSSNNAETLATAPAQAAVDYAQPAALELTAHGTEFHAHLAREMRAMADPGFGASAIKHVGLLGDAAKAVEVATFGTVAEIAGSAMSLMTGGEQAVPRSHPVFAEVRALRDEFMAGRFVEGVAAQGGARTLLAA